MWQFLRDLNAGGTSIILTTHYLEEAENLCRHVAIIDRGRVIERGPMGTVLTKLTEEVFLLTPREPVLTVPVVPGFEVRLNTPLELEAALPHSRSANELFAALSAVGVEITSLRNKANRLEELFLNLTERKARLPGLQGPQAVSR
jgi:ABC-2 type transport system ATP-binding protein